jgi:MFS family permease
VLLAQLLVVIDVSIVTLALPTIQRALHFSPPDLQWVLSGYALTFGGFLLLGGRLADLLGRRRILIIGATVFTAASLACGLAVSAGALVAARAVEGLGAAMMARAALSLILAMFPEGPERNKALGAFGAVSGAGGAIGVLAGGMLTTWLSWPWIFFVNLPVGVLIVAGARPLLRESRADLGHRRFDMAGAVTVTAGLSLLVYAVVTTSSHGWASATTIGLLAGAAALIVAFVAIEARSSAPLLPLSFFRNRTVAAANLAGLLLGGLMFPMFVFLSLYMQQIGGAVGLAVTTTVAAARTTTLLHAGRPPAVALTGGFHSAFAITGALALAAALVTVILIRRNPVAEPLAPADLATATQTVSAGDVDAG